MWRTLPKGGPAGMCHEIAFSLKEDPVVPGLEKVFMARGSGDGYNW